MSNIAGQPPILEAAKYTWRFTLATIGPTLPAYLVRALVVGATNAAIFSALNGGAIPLDLIGSILGFAITIACVALTLKLALGGEIKGVAGLSFGMDEARLMSAHAIYYALFLFLMFIAGFLAFVLFIPVIAMQLPDLSSIENDQAAMQVAIEEFFLSPSGIFIGLIYLIVVAIPLLYMSARLVTFPAATLHRQRIMIFETWEWTKGNVWPVMVAMLLTLAPLWLLSMAGLFIASAVTGLPLMVGGLTAGEVVLSPMLGFVFGLITGVFSIPFTIASAGLSAFMYKGFDPDPNAF